MRPGGIDPIIRRVSWVDEVERMDVAV